MTTTKHTPTTQTSTHPQMEALCESFPCLRGKAGTMPWNQHVFDHGTRGMSSGEIHAARFVLAVWNGWNGDDESPPWWRAGAFDLVRACASWDAANREACLAWIEIPFFP